MGLFQHISAGGRWAGALLPTGSLLVVLLASLGPGDARADRFEEEHRCLALTLYWEARGESERGRIAVGWTVLNRVASNVFPDSPCGVVFQGGESPPCQFSWWCDGNSDRPRDRDSWRRAQVLAARLLTNPPADPTNGALFFHSRGVRASWAPRREKTVRIGNHVFYR